MVNRLINFRKILLIAIIIIQVLIIVMGFVSHIVEGLTYLVIFGYTIRFCISCYKDETELEKQQKYNDNLVKLSEAILKEQLKGKHSQDFFNI